MLRFWFHVPFVGLTYVQRENGKWFNIPFVGLIYMQKKNESHYAVFV